MLRGLFTGGLLLQAAKAALAGKGNLTPAAGEIAEQAYKTAAAPFGTGSALQQGIQAATAAVQGLAGGQPGAGGNGRGGTVPDRGY